MTPRTTDEQSGFARKLRSQMTSAEAMLWRSLRDRRLGAKFRRQVPVGPFVADFACVAARRVVELDGRSHDEDGRRMRDLDRDIFFDHQGWRVLRLPDDLVLAGGDIVLARIKNELTRFPSTGPR